MAFGERLLLCVGAAQATLGRWRAGRLVDCQTFSDDDRGLRRFSDVLTAARNLQIHALVDAVEEDYRTELLPHTMGRDRAGMVQRRLRQLYRNSPYNAAVLQGRETDKRRDDRYLFAALTNAEVFLPWAEAIEDAKIPFAGLYLLPMVMPQLAERLGVTSAPTLIITATASGLRQSFVAQGQLRVSRLTPLERIGAGGPMDNLVEEVGNTRLYLEALKLRSADDPLSVTLIETGDSMRGAVAALERQGGNLQCTRIDAATLAKRLPLSMSMLRDTPDALMLTLLGLRTPSVNLAPAPALRRFQVRTTQRAMYATAAAIAATGLTFALANVWQYSQLVAQTSEQRMETARWQERYVAVTLQFPEAPAPLETLQRTVEAARHIAGQTRTPERAFAVVATALDAQADVGLKKITWRHGEPLQDTDTSRSTAQRGAPGQRSAERVESLAIEAEINTVSGDLRTTIASIEGFAQRLRDDARVQSATIVRLPLNLSPGSSLSGNTQERTEQSAGSAFRIIVVLRRAAT